MKRTIALAAVAALAATAAIPALRAQGADPQKTVDAAYAKFRTLKEGRTPTTFPPLPRSTRTCSASRS